MAQRPARDKLPRNSKGIARLRVLACVACVIVLPLIVFGAAPNWWSSREVIAPGSTPNDYAAANQGQVKNIAKAAVEELDAHIPGGAGTTLHNLVNSWATPLTSGTIQTNDYAAINLGQLKTLAKPFYDRLIVVGYTTQYPWTGASNPPNDYAMANIGQVKNLFGFDLTGIHPLYDADQNGIPDWWEADYLGGMGQNAAGDPDGDGLSNLTEYLAGTDPNMANGESGAEFAATELRVFTPLE